MVTAAQTASLILTSLVSLLNYVILLWQHFSVCLPSLAMDKRNLLAQKTALYNIEDEVKP